MGQPNQKHPDLIPRDRLQSPNLSHEATSSLRTCSSQLWHEVPCMKWLHVDPCPWDIRTKQGDRSPANGSLSHQVVCSSFNRVQPYWCCSGEDGDRGLLEEEKMGTAGCLRRKTHLGWKASSPFAGGALPRCSTEGAHSSCCKPAE